MDKSLIQRRECAAARHDAAIAKDPSRASAAFVAELRAVVDELTAICKEADRPGIDPVELARTHRWLGDAYFDLGRSKDSDALSQGAIQYERAEALLAREQAPVERAKLQFNFANTLRGLSGGTDMGLLEAAETRYESAAKAFRANRLNDLARTADEQLASIRPQLTLARQYARLTSGTKAVEAKLEQARQDPARAAALLGEFQRLSATSGSGTAGQALEDALTAISDMVHKHPERIPDGDQRLEQLKRMSDALIQQMRGLEPAAAGSADERVAPLLGLLVQRLQQEADSGTVSPERNQQLEEMLQRVWQVMAMPDGDIGAMQRKASAMRALLSEMPTFLNQPSSKPFPAGALPVLIRNLGILEQLRRRLIAEKMTAMAPEGEAQAATDLLSRLLKAEARIRDFATELSAATRIDDEIWGLAADVQRYSRRRHLMLVVPKYQTASYAADPRSVFISGDKVLEDAAAILRKSGDIVPVPPPRGGDYAEGRWNQLWSSTAAAFDLGVEPGPALAQICYELGLALTLGKPSVVIVRTGQVPPFNVSQQPVVFTGEAKSDSAVLMTGLTRALSEPVWGGAEAGLEHRRTGALESLKLRYGERLERGTLPIAMKMAEERLDDPIALRQALDNVLGLLGAGSPMAVLPAWPPVYPDPSAAPQCFHVMPFSPNWARATRNLAEKLCVGIGWRYRRGDESEEQRIIRGIWREIAMSSAVLVDITGYNPNVALELGLAHALGKETTVIAQRAKEPTLFPAISKVQVSSYRVEGGGFPGFREAVSALLRRAPSSDRLEG